MENEIVEALNRQTDLLHKLIGLVNKLLAEKNIEKDWCDKYEAMEILKVCSRTLERYRKNHPELCRRELGQWRYDLNMLRMFKGTG